MYVFLDSRTSFTYDVSHYYVNSFLNKNEQQFLVAFVDSKGDLMEWTAVPCGIYTYNVLTTRYSCMFLGTHRMANSMASKLKASSLNIFERTMITWPGQRRLI